MRSQRRGIRRRDQSAQERLRAADERDVIAHARDLAALTRDTAAGAREPGARGFQQAVEQDARAAEDRHSAAQDREQAACERLHALVDRELLADALDRAAYDELTGARARAAGLTELDHELDRCRRTRQPARRRVRRRDRAEGAQRQRGPRRRRRAAQARRRAHRRHLRSYDLIIRVGGDEFVCAMSDMTLLDARRRFGQVADALAAAPGVGAIRTGLAQLTGRRERDGARRARRRRAARQRPRQPLTRRAPWLSAARVRSMGGWHGTGGLVGWTA